MGVIFAIDVKHGETHQRDECEHVENGQHDIKVGVNTIAESKERLVLELGLTLWHSNLHLFEQGLPESVSEIRLASLSTLPERLQESKNVVQLSGPSHWVQVFHIHEALVDLLSSQNVWLLNMSTVEEFLQLVFVDFFHILIKLISFIKIVNSIPYKII